MNSLNYKINKYVEKLKNAKTLEETDMYQTKLRQYHHQKQIQAGGQESITDIVKQIKEAVAKLGDRMEACDKALQVVSLLADRINSLEKKFNEIQSNIQPTQQVAGAQLETVSLSLSDEEFNNDDSL